jgi:hypothetical protein
VLGDKKHNIIFFQGKPEEACFAEAGEISDYVLPSDSTVRKWKSMQKKGKGKPRQTIKWKLEGYEIVQGLQEEGVTSEWHFKNIPIYRSTFSNNYSSS